MTDRSWLVSQFAFRVAICLAYHVTTARLNKMGWKREITERNSVKDYGNAWSVWNGRKAKWSLWQRRVLRLEGSSGECCLPREGGRSRHKQQRDIERKTAAKGRVDLGKGQRHLPTPADCHPSSHRSHIKLKDWLWGGSCHSNCSGCHGDCYVWKISQ